LALKKKALQTEKSPGYTPGSVGFLMPPEWFPHQGTWLAWPTNKDTWPTRLEGVQERYLELMVLLAACEQVNLLVDSDKILHQVSERARCLDMRQENIRFHIVPTMDAWIRDYGPNFLVRERNNSIELAINDWVFNAWGDKYPELVSDDQIPEEISGLLDVPRFEPGAVLEGGAIDVNGSGLGLATRQCLLNRNRNRHLKEDQIEEYLGDFLGVRRVIWLDQGLAGDDTDGHVDNLARFTGPNSIVATEPGDSTNPDYSLLKENLKVLDSFSEKEQISLITLPRPDPIFTRHGRAPASYTNFYIANSTVLVPTFHQSSDEQALMTLGELFPKRRVVGIDCTDIIQGLGGIHCLTLQQPLSGEGASPHFSQSGYCGG
jgi:agmatine deiminase